MESKQLFILGAPRSGTTFLASVLSDSKYGTPIETHFITKYYKSLRKYGDLSSLSNFRQLIKQILRERPIQQWGLTLNIDRFFLELSPDYSYSHIVDALLSRYRLGNPGASWGDKTPHYLEDVEILPKLFPNAKFIYIVRDGRDVALSLLKKPWGPNNIVSCAEYWTLLNSRDDELDKIGQEGSLFFLHYEKLLEDPVGTTRDIYGFLGEELPESRVSFIQKYTKTTNKEKWKSEMTANQIRRFEAVAGNKLKALGYPVLNPKSRLSNLEIVFFSAHEILSKGVHLFNLNIVDWVLIRLGKKQPFAD